ncbi:hypothetical protein [Methylomonas lenta]|uniref:hypothetical protein n=1 Tax=Methylomonas lenta TaxID=980561 RepID=UPI000AC21B68|nr:hypothetical protein [Methylomonas lenta]
MEYMSLLGFGACAPDADIRAGMPFPVSDIIRAPFRLCCVAVVVRRPKWHLQPQP